MPTPYISRQPNDLIRAVDWNGIQVQAREEIQGHGHTGGDDGAQLGTDALADGSITAEKLAPGVGGEPLPSPLAVDITGSTVRTVPVGPVFDCFSLTVPRINGAIQAPLNDGINIQSYITNIIDLIENFVTLNYGPMGFIAAGPGLDALARIACIMIDNLPRHLIESFGVDVVHQAVAQHLPAYVQQLDLLNALTNGTGVSTALELVSQLDSPSVGPEVRSFGNALASQLADVLVDAGSLIQLNNVLATNPTIGGFTNTLAPNHPGIYAGRLRPIENAMILRIAQPAGGSGCVLSSCEALVTVSMPINAACVIGIGTETLPPPPGQVVFLNPGVVAPPMVLPTQSANVRRSMVHLPAMAPDLPRSLRLWAALIASPGVSAGRIIHARLDCHHVLLETHGAPTVITP